MDAFLLGRIVTAEKNVLDFLHRIQHVDPIRVTVVVVW